MKKAPICDRDCFNCPYEDCINDVLTAQDYRDVPEDRRERTRKENAIAAAKREYYAANREKIAAAQREYREANREKIAAAQREYREANREKIAAYHREYREANRDAIAAYQREYYEANKDAIAAYKREYYEANKDAIAAYKRLSEHKKRMDADIAACGLALRKWRKEHGLTQIELAAELGADHSTVARWEAGRNRIPTHIKEMCGI